MNTPIKGKLYDAEISRSFYNLHLTKVTIIHYRVTSVGSKNCFIIQEAKEMLSIKNY